MSVSILNLGCITQDWRVPVSGARVPVVLGYADPVSYLNNPYYLGVIAGRVANRIGGARFDLNGQTWQLDANEERNHLHGGPSGLGRQLWTVERDGARCLRLSLVSEHLDQRYPGQAEFVVTISLSGTCLTYDMRATVDRPTPVNLAQHSYYNLMGQGLIDDHRLTVPASKLAEVDAEMIPTGQFLPVSERGCDFRATQPLDGAKDLDVSLLLDDPDPLISLTAPNGLHLQMRTDQPSLQVYSGAHLSVGAAAIAGQSHRPCSGLCLEPQHLPDSPNQPGFPSIIATPEAPYSQVLHVDIAERSE